MSQAVRSKHDVQASISPLPFSTVLQCSCNIAELPVDPMLPDSMGWGERSSMQLYRQSPAGQGAFPPLGWGGPTPLLEQQRLQAAIVQPPRRGSCSYSSCLGTAIGLPSTYLHVVFCKGRSLSWAIKWCWSWWHSLQEEKHVLSWF